MNPKCSNLVVYKDWTVLEISYKWYGSEVEAEVAKIPIVALLPCNV